MDKRLQAQMLRGGVALTIIAILIVIARSALGFEIQSWNILGLEIPGTLFSGLFVVLGLYEFYILAPRIDLLVVISGLAIAFSIVGAFYERFIIAALLCHIGFVIVFLGLHVLLIFGAWIWKIIVMTWNFFTANDIQVSKKRKSK